LTILKSQNQSKGKSIQQDKEIILSSVRNSLQNLTNLLSTTTADNPPIKPIKKIKCGKCFKKEEKKKHNHSFTFETNQVHYTKQINNLQKYKQTIIKGHKFKLQNKSMTEANSYVNSIIGTEANNDIHNSPKKKMT